MIKIRVRIALAAIALSQPHDALSQAPAIVQEFATARVAARGGTGIANDGEPDSRFVNPSLLADSAILSVVVGTFRMAVSDVDETRAGVTGRFGKWGDVAIDARQRRVNKLFDDPTLAADPSLQVTEGSFRFTYARRIGNRIRLGAASEYFSSSIFGTTGGGRTTDVGMNIMLTTRLEMGVVGRHLDGAYVWHDESGAQWASSLGRNAGVGLAWRPLATRRTIGVTIRVDRDIALEQAASESWRGGVTIKMLRFLFLQAGSRMQHRPTKEVAASAGMSVRVRGMTVDIARDHLGALVGERTLIAATLSR